ncbi:MAG: TrkH family potassium uptake protein [Magnetococcales bacterium]|nr:TrkH family potassium uptake protein [Magnetococcales bacterium]
MNWLMDFRVLALVSGILTVYQTVPLVYAVAVGESALAMELSMLCSLALFGVGWLTTGRAERKLSARDGFLITSVVWFMAAFLGGLPYVFADLLGWIDAFFETASGLTTTGSSVLTDIEVWPKNLLLWRAMTQWVGGMGILLLAIAILPFLGVGGMQLMKAEVPGPSKDRLVPRLATTARIFWSLYVGITLAAVISFYFSGMSWYDAFCHAFTALATGGYSTKNASFAAFSPAAQWWCTFFMAMGGANFVIHYRLFMKGDLGAFSDTELRGYLMLICGTSLIIAATMYSQNFPGMDTVESALRHAFFQVVSIMTTTGFASIDWEQWPALMQFLLIALMIPGGMAGSTGGGIKVVRLQILLNMIPVTARRMMKPSQIVVTKLGGYPLNNEMIEASVAMTILYLLLMVFIGILLNVLGMDLPSAMSASLTAIANVGPGVGEVGAMDNFSAVHPLGKVLLSSLMIIGRLEVFTVMIFFSSWFWKR